MINLILIVLSVLLYFLSIIFTTPIHEIGHCIMIIITSKRFGLEKYRKQVVENCKYNICKDPRFYEQSDSSLQTPKWFTASKIYGVLQENREDKTYQKWIKLNAIAGLATQITTVALTAIIFCTVMVYYLKTIPQIPSKYTVIIIVVIISATIFLVILIKYPFKRKPDYAIYKNPSSFVYIPKKTKKSKKHYCYSCEKRSN